MIEPVRENTLCRLEGTTDESEYFNSLSELVRHYSSAARASIGVRLRPDDDDVFNDGRTEGVASRGSSAAPSDAGSLGSPKDAKFGFDDTDVANGHFDAAKIQQQLATGGFTAASALRGPVYTPGPDSANNPDIYFEHQQAAQVR